MMVAALEDLPGRITRRIQPCPVTGCWIWGGYLNVYGYGVISVSGVRRMAHRRIYELLVGPIPEGLQLDHLCRVRHCVAPWHVEPVTCRENLHRGQTAAAINAAKTVCAHGHPLTADNVYLDADGDSGRFKRRCKTCRHDRYIRSRYGAQPAND